MFHHINAKIAVSVVTCAVIMPLWATAEEPLASLDISPRHSAVFAGERADFHCVVTARQSFRGRLGWSLSVEGAILARREAAVWAERAAQGATRVPITLDVPAAGPGVILPAVLAVSIIADGQPRAAATLRKRLWIFYKNPFQGRSAWLKSLDIRLFDPQGETRRVFQKAGIPFTPAHNLDALANLDGGLLVIGQGISLKEYPGLAKVTIAAASRGAEVLCLPPAEGHFDLLGTESNRSSRAKGVILRREDVIHDFDKRLDAAAWPEDGRILAGSLKICCDRDQVVAMVDPSAQHWSWLEVRFPTGNGRLVICCFDIIAKWEAGPTPRFLLARVLEYLDNNQYLSLTKEKYHET